MNAKELPPLVAAREKIVTTAIAYRKAILARDAAYEENPPGKFLRVKDWSASESFKLTEMADRRERVHLKAVEAFFELCKKFNVEPH